MTRVESSVVIDAPASRIFEAMIDTRRHREFVHNYVEQYDGPEILSLGVRFHWRMRLYGLTRRVHSLVSAFDLPRQYQEKIRINGFMDAVLTKTLEEVNGGTRLTWTWDYAPAFGAPGAIVDRIIGGRRTALRGLEESLKKLKEVMESE
jgi:hypothetical protein